MRRVFAFVTVLALCAAAVAAAPSCSTETTATLDTGCPSVGTTPKISIVSPADGACVEAGSGADAFIPVVVAAENFKIDAPGACADCGSCGHIALSVNGQHNNDAATSVVDLQFQGNIANHFGDLTLTVQLVGDDGTPWAPFVDADAGDGARVANAPPITATVSITTRKSCEAGASSSSSGGTGGAGGAGGGASSSSSGGTGGAGNGGAGGSASSSSGGTGGAGNGGAGGKAP